MLSSVSTSLLRFNYFLPSKKVSINEEEENLLLLFLLLKMLAKMDGCTRKYSIFLLLFRVSYEGLDNWLKLRGSLRCFLRSCSFLYRISVVGIFALFSAGKSGVYTKGEQK